MFYCLPKLSFILIFTSYLLGSIPFGIFVAKFMGHGDIRKHGSGNIGATNVLRKTGKIGGIITLVLDGGKGVLAMYLASTICPDYLLLIFCGVASVVGHIFPIWLKFKGGKGVATGLAVIAMMNYYIGIVAVAIWLIAFLIFRISSLSALIAFCVTPIFAYFTTYDPRLAIACAIISLLVIIRHKDNIKRLMEGKEG